MFKGQIAIAAWVLRQLARNTFILRRKPQDYRKTRWQRPAEVNDLPFDVPTAIALRIAPRFPHFVEIGAASGSRTFAINRAMPTLDATAMDVGPDYAEERFVDGVRFASYSPENIKPGSLVFCVGTLSYAEPDEVHRLFSRISEADCALLMFEPTPPFSISKPMRRAADCWYHPYDAIAQLYALTDAADNAHAWRHHGSLKNFEIWRCAHFQRR